MLSTRTISPRILSWLVSSAVTILIAVAFAGVASAQNVVTDIRWRPWLGCWIPEARGAETATIAVSASEVCVLPAPGVSAVDVVTVTDGRVVSRERIAADGVRRETVSDGCARSEQVEWSADERRVYLRSEYQCPGGVKRSSTALFSLSPTGAWLDVSSATIGDNTGVRVLRYAASPDLPSVLGAEIVASLQGQMSAIEEVRTAAASLVDTADITDVSQHVSAAVVQTWLAELDQKFTVTADTLVALSRASIPDPVIDVIVALAYPRVFSLEASDITMRPALRAGDDSSAAAETVNRAELFRCRPSSSGPNSVLARARCLSAYRNYDPTWYDYYGRYPYYGTWYFGSAPISVVMAPSSPSATPSSGHGQVVNGRGYSQGRADTPPASGNASGTGAASSSSTPSSTSAPASPTSSSPADSPSSSESGERTAHPR